MTINEELERAVERLRRAVLRPAGTALVDHNDLRALLSERAELLAAVERMRGALTAISGLSSAGNHDISQTAARGILQRIEAFADAALTTGEGK